MSRDVPWDKEAVCDNCGEVGAFDFMGDYFCDRCAAEGYDEPDSDDDRPVVTDWQEDFFNDDY